MKTFTLVLKGMLLWMTAFSIFCFMAGGVESLVEQNNWLAAGFWLIINIALGYICYNVISYRELHKLSGSQLLNRLLRQ